MSEIIGRKREISELLRFAESKESEMMIVYGRRRVGKTYLIRETFKNNFAFYHTGLSPRDIPESNLLRAQLHHFNLTLKFTWQGYDGEDPENWLDAFALLRKYLDQLPKYNKQIIFIDELPWMATPRSGFLTAFEAFWNSWAAGQGNLYLIVCGSATSWIVNNLLKDYGGLYGRSGHSIYLEQFSLAECEQYEDMRGSLRSKDEILRGYMILGGIPYYWKQLDPALSLAQNIDALFFSPIGMLRKEFDALYASVFRKPKMYIRTIKALSEKRGGLTRNEIIEKLQMKSGGNITKILKDLEESGFIFSYKSLSKDDDIYMLTDFYTLFYYKFVEDNKNLDPSYWSNSQNTPTLNNWQGLTFELVCLVHSPQIRRALQFATVQSKMILYRSQTAQIDLLFDRADNTVSICEMKYSQEPYELSAGDDEKIRTRIAEMRKYFPAKTSYKIAFVSPFGIIKGKNSSLVSGEVTLNDLFQL